LVECVNDLSYLFVTVLVALWARYELVVYFNLLSVVCPVIISKNAHNTTQLAVVIDDRHVTMCVRDTVLPSAQQTICLFGTAVSHVTVSTVADKLFIAVVIFLLSLQ